MWLPHFLDSTLNPTYLKSYSPEAATANSTQGHYKLKQTYIPGEYSHRRKPIPSIPIKCSL